MDIFYLIDYENCSKDGLSGCEHLGSNAHIYLLYTENHKNITLDFFNNHGKASLEIAKVPTGAQSLDKHLIAYLGYLIGRTNCVQAEYVIITSDKGYDKVGEFLEEQCDNIKIVRKSKISEHLGLTKKSATKTSETKKVVAKKKPELKKALLESKEILLLENNVTSLLNSPTSNENEVILKNIKSKEATPKDTTSKEKKSEQIRTKHNEIQQNLSKAGMGQEVLSFVPGFVIKHIGDENHKMVIYRGIIQKFGQKKGLEVYTRIKKQL